MLSWLLLVLCDSGLAGASGSSKDCDRAATELRGEGGLFCGRTLRPARPEEIEDEEELLCSGADGMGCVVRARDERRGDMTWFWFAKD